MKWYGRGSYLPYVGVGFSAMRVAGYVAHGKRKKAIREAAGMAASAVGGKYAKAIFKHHAKAKHVGVKTHKYAKAKHVGYVHGQASSEAAKHNYRGRRNNLR